MLFSPHFYPQDVIKIAGRLYFAQTLPINILIILYIYCNKFIFRAGRFYKFSDARRHLLCKNYESYKLILLDNLKMFCIIYVLFNFLGGIITIYGRHPT